MVYVVALGMLFDQMMNHFCTFHISTVNSPKLFLLLKCSVEISSNLVLKTEF